MRTLFILYVADQERSKRFYARILDQEPTLDVPGMTEFTLGDCKLGLMPNDGIAKIITPALPHPTSGNGIPRCELYLLVDDVAPYCDRAVAAGAVEVDPMSFRDWGHRVAYFADPDGHVLALARRNEEA